MYVRMRARVCVNMHVCTCTANLHPVMSSDPTSQQKSPFPTAVPRGPYAIFPFSSPWNISGRTTNPRSWSSDQNQYQNFLDINQGWLGVGWEALGSDCPLWHAGTYRVVEFVSRTRGPDVSKHSLKWEHRFLGLNSFRWQA